MQKKAADLTATIEHAHHGVSADSIREIERLVKEAQPLQVRDANDSGTHPTRADLALVPDGHSLVDLFPYSAPVPSAKATFQEPDSFVQYVNRYRTADTILSVDQDALSFTAHIDYHGKLFDSTHSPARSALVDQWRPCSHVAKLQLRKSPELLDWEKLFGKWTPQGDFAEWLEDHSHHISAPSPADVLSVARELQVATAVTFSGAQRKADGGYNITYKEDTTGAIDQLEVPSAITLAIPLFSGEDPAPLECLLRYRLSNGGLNFMVRPLRLEEALRESVKTIRGIIREATTLDPLAGAITTH